MTPAEKLSSKKTRKRVSKKTTGNTQRNKPYTCKAAIIRAKLGLSIQDVAKEIGLSVAGLWQIEYGTDPMLSTAQRICKFYGKTIDELWEKAK